MRVKISLLSFVPCRCNERATDTSQHGLPARGTGLEAFASKVRDKAIRNQANERGATAFVQISKAGSGNAFYAIFSRHEAARKNIYSFAPSCLSGPREELLQSYFSMRTTLRL
jgi:hypothetical protein